MSACRFPVHPLPLIILHCLFAASVLLSSRPTSLFGGEDQDSASGVSSAKALIKAGHWKRAREQVEPLYKANPNDAELNYLMSQIHEAFGDLTSARAFAEKSVAFKSSESRYHRQLADVDGETAQTASLFAKGGWAKKFKAEADTAAALDPRNIEARFDLLEYYLQAPRLMGGGKDKAAAMAEEIGKIDPAQGYVAQARLAEDRKDAVAQESWLLKAVAAKPNDHDTLVAVAAFYLRPPQPNFPEAEKCARKAIEADANRADAYALLATSLASQSRWNELDKALAKADANVPDDRVPYYRAGVAILTAADSESAELRRAEGYFRKYFGTEPEGGEPPLAGAHWRLGEVLEKQGRKAEAKSELEEALSLKPDLEGAKKDLKQLE